MAKKDSTIRVQCTCCDAVLTVDKASGEVVFTDKPKTKKYSFEDAFQKVQQDQETAEDRFKEAFTKEKDRMKVIDQKFEEAMKRKDELEMPIKPIDLD
jgi:fatty acid-binding protein DegV